MEKSEKQIEALYIISHTAGTIKSELPLKSKVIFVFDEDYSVDISVSWKYSGKVHALGVKVDVMESCRSKSYLDGNIGELINIVNKSMRECAAKEPDHNQVLKRQITS